MGVVCKEKLLEISAHGIVEESEADSFANCFRKRLQADLGARLLPCLLDGLLANIQGAFFTRAFEGFLARLIQRLVTSILTTRDVKATSNAENVLGGLAYCSFDVTAWVV